MQDKDTHARMSDERASQRTGCSTLSLTEQCNLGTYRYEDFAIDRMKPE